MSELMQADVDLIEEMIDRVGMAKLTDAIVRIAEGKAIHVEENWQDRNLAKVWTRIARKFDKLVPALELNDDVLGFGK